MTIKYWNGNLWDDDFQQKNAFVCVKTKKQAVLLLKKYGVSSSRLRTHWSDTANDHMKNIAKEQIGVYIASNNQSEDYKLRKN